MPSVSLYRCPFFESKTRNKKQSASITCEIIDNNLGFEMRNQLSFKNHNEMADYGELFCMDMYEACPYYKAIYAKKYEEDGHEKEKFKRTGRNCRDERA